MKTISLSTISFMALFFASCQFALAVSSEHQTAVRFLNEAQPNLYKPSHRLEVRELFEKATCLIEDDDPAKAYLLWSLAGMNEEPKMRRDLYQRAAYLAEKNHMSVAAKYYFQLAFSELETDQSDQAIFHTRRAVELQQRQDYPFGFPNFLIPAEALAKRGREREAEVILREAVNKVNLVYGPTSPAAVYQLTRLFQYLVNEKKDVEALKTLEAVLQIGPAKLDVRESYGESSLSSIERQTVSLLQEKRMDLARKIWSTILAAQRKEFVEDDARIAPTLLQIARINEAQGQSQLAEENVRAALAIKKLYVGQLKALYDVRPDLIPVLRSQGKTQEVEELRDLEKTEAFKHVNEADNPASLVHAGFDLAHPTESIRFLKKEYATAVADAPYSLRSGLALDHLMYVASHCGDWSVMAEASIARININERMTFGASREAGCMTVDFPYPRIHYYRSAALAKNQLGKTDEAKRWIARAVDRSVRPLLIGELIELGEVALECDDRSLAIHFAEQAESLLNEPSINPARDFQAIEEFWKRLGNASRAETVSRLHDDWAHRQKEAELLDSKSVFSELPGYPVPWCLREPVPPIPKS